MNLLWCLRVSLRLAPQCLHSTSMRLCLSSMERHQLCHYPPTVTVQKLILALELQVFLSSCWLSLFTLIIVGGISALTIFNMKLLLWLYVLYAGAARILRDSEGMQCVLNGGSNCPFVMIFCVQFLALTSTPSLNTQQSSHFEHAPFGCFGLSAYLCPQSHLILLLFLSLPHREHRNHLIQTGESSLVVHVPKLS